MGKKGNFVDNKTYRTFFVMNLIAAFDFVLHVIYGFIFLAWTPNADLLLVHLVGTVITLCGFILNRTYHSRACTYLLTFEILTSTVIWTGFLGLSSGMFLFFFAGLLPHFLFTDVTRNERIVFCMAALASGDLSVIIHFHPDIESIIYDHTRAFMLLNMNMTVGALIFELYLNILANHFEDRLIEKAIQSATDDSMKDTLTDLWNRRYFAAQSHTLLNNPDNEKFCAVMLDIDHFKNVNDAYSHEIGDKLLIHFADLMRQSFRKSDMLIRWGGEEFVIVLRGVKGPQAYEMMEAFREKTAASPLLTGNLSIPFTFTCGIAEYTNETTAEAVVSIADIRMYHGKRTGRNRSIYKNIPEQRP
jgi:diguanylate cyclase (GGDEF)-like protein